MYLNILKRFYLLLTVMLVISCGCEAAVVSGSANFGVSNRPIYNPIKNTNSNINMIYNPKPGQVNSSISQNAHSMGTSVTHTSVPTLGMKPRPPYPPNSHGMLPPRGGMVNNRPPAGRYPVNNQYRNGVYSSQSYYYGAPIYYPQVNTQTVTTTTYTNGGTITSTYSEDYSPYSKSYFGGNLRKFLSW